MSQWFVQRAQVAFLLLMLDTTNVSCEVSINAVPTLDQNGQSDQSD